MTEQSLAHLLAELTGKPFVEAQRPAAEILRRLECIDAYSKARLKSLETELTEFHLLLADHAERIERLERIIKGEDTPEDLVDPRPPTRLGDEFPEPIAPNPPSKAVRVDSLPVGARCWVECEVRSAADPDGDVMLELADAEGIARLPMSGGTLVIPAEPSAKGTVEAERAWHCVECEVRWLSREERTCPRCGCDPDDARYETIDVVDAGGLVRLCELHVDDEFELGGKVRIITRVLNDGKVVTVLKEFTPGSGLILSGQTLVSRVAKETSPSPVDMLLFCPSCRAQHIDAPQPEKAWTNPPHRSHECQACGHVWRPADVPTNGVAKIATQGQRDGSPAPVPREAATTDEVVPGSKLTAGDSIFIDGAKCEVRKNGGGLFYSHTTFGLCDIHSDRDYLRVSRASVGTTPLQLRVGHRYKRRDGEVTVCERRNDPAADGFRFECRLQVNGLLGSYFENGRYWATEETSRDLIEDLGPVAKESEGVKPRPAWAAGGTSRSTLWRLIEVGWEDVTWMRHSGVFSLATLSELSRRVAVGDHTPEEHARQMLSELEVKP